MNHEETDILKEKGMPQHFIVLMCNLYCGEVDLFKKSHIKILYRVTL